MFAQIWPINLLKGDGARAVKKRVTREVSYISLKSSDGKARSLAEIERDAILITIEHCAGNVARAAQLLAIGRSTVYRKLSTYKNY